MISGKVTIKVADKELGEIDLKKGLSGEEAEKMTLRAILAGEPIIYTKGMAASIKLGEGYSRTFKVKKPFALHGFRKHEIFVTIPITLGTLKGLGFITEK